MGGALPGRKEVPHCTQDLIDGGLCVDVSWFAWEWQSSLNHICLGFRYIIISVYEDLAISLQQIEFAGFYDGKGAFSYPKFVVDILIVIENSVQADKKLICDFLIFQSSGEESQNF